MNLDQSVADEKAETGIPVSFGNSATAGILRHDPDTSHVELAGVIDHRSQGVQEFVDGRLVLQRREGLLEPIQGAVGRGQGGVSLDVLSRGGQP